MAPATTTTMIDVADLLAALLPLRLLGQAGLPRGALAGSLVAGHGPRPYPIPGRPRIAPGPRAAVERPGVEAAPQRPSRRAQSVASSGCRWSSRSSGVPRSATPIGSAPWPTTSPAPGAQGSDVVAVVSAMGKTTDDLIRLANSVSATPAARASTTCSSAPGERISMALLVMALADLGVDAASFTGSQAGIITDTDHTRAKIKEIRADRLREALAAGKVPGGRRVPGRVDGARRSRPSAAAARTPRRWRWPPCSAPTPARSTPTSPASSPPTRGSCPRRAGSTGSRSTRCSRSRPPAGRVLHAARRSSSPATTTSRCTCAAASPGSRAPGWSRRMQTWKKPSSPP